MVFALVGMERNILARSTWHSRGLKQSGTFGLPKSREHSGHQRVGYTPGYTTLGTCARIQGQHHRSREHNGGRSLYCMQLRGAKRVYLRTQHSGRTPAAYVDGILHATPSYQAFLVSPWARPYPRLRALLRTRGSDTVRLPQHSSEIEYLSVSSEACLLRRAGVVMGGLS